MSRIFKISISTVFCLLLIQQSNAQNVVNDSIHFDDRRASLNFNALSSLNTLADKYEQDHKSIQLSAVTLEAEDMMRARKLSLRRAETIKAYLIAIGVDAESITISEYLPNEFLHSIAEFSSNSFIEIKKTQR